MTDDERARAEQILGGLEGLLTGPLPQDKERKVRNIEHVLNCLTAYGRDERRRALEDVARECERRLDGCNTKGSWSQKVKELVAIKEWCRRQAEGGENMNEIVVWVVKSHNVTSGKGGYGLHGVFWDRDEAEAVAERLNLSKSPRLYSIHKFMEEAHG